jgi:autotransporter-associated beta strand protein
MSFGTKDFSMADFWVVCDGKDRLSGPRQRIAAATRWAMRCLVTLLAIAGAGEVHAQVWDGGGTTNNWTEAANWNPNTAPAAGDDLTFAGTTKLDPFNNFAAGTAFRRIFFSNGAGDFVLTGSSILLEERIVNDDVSGLQTLNLNISVGAVEAVSSIGGGSTLIGGTISGIGAFNVGAAGATYTGQVIFSASNTFSGAMTVTRGRLTIRNGSALGTTGAGTTVASGGALELEGGIAVGAETLSVAGTGISTGGALRNLSGTNSYGGAITQTAATRINSDAGLLTLSGTIGGVFGLTFGGAGDITVSNTIGIGTGTLTKDGAGTLTLSAANSFSGTTTLSAGALVLGNGAALVNSTLDAAAATTVSFGGLSAANIGGLAGSSGITLSNTSGGAVALTVGGNNAATSFTGVLGGGGSLTKAGTGNLTLGTASTYTGTTAILSGTVSTGSVVVAGGASGFGNASSVVTLGSATSGALSYTGNSATFTRGLVIGAGGGRLDVTTAGQTLTIDTANVTGSGTFTVGGAGNVFVASALQQTAGLTKDGSGTLTLSTANSYTGTTTITAGAINVQNSAALGTTAAGVTVASGGALELQGGVAIIGEPLSLNGTGIASGGALRNVSGNNSYGGVITLAAASQINSDSGTLTIDSTGTITGNFGLTLGGNGDIVLADPFSPATVAQPLTKTGAGTLTLSAVNGYTGLTTISGGTLRFGVADAFSGAVTISGGGTLDLATFNDTLGTVTLTNGNIVGTGTLTSSANYATTSGTISAPLAGTIGIAQAASGTTVITASNSFSGASTVAAAGALHIQNSRALGGTTSGVTVSDGGSLWLSGDIAVGAEPLSVRGVGVDGNGGLKNVSGTNSYAGTITLSNVLTIGSDAGLLTLSGTIVGGNRALTLTGNGDLTFSGSVGAIASMTKNGTGRVTISTGNANAGLTTINAGVVRAANDLALGTTGAATTVAAGAALELAGNISIGAESLTAFAGTGVSNGGALRNVSGTNTFGGAITFTAAATIAADADTQLNLTNTLGGAFLKTFQGGGNISASNVISGAAGLTMAGPGVLTLSGNNTYTGVTTISAGTVSASSIVVASSASNLGNATSAVVLGDASNQGTLSYTGNSATYTRGFTVNAGGGRLDATTAGQTLTVGTGNITGSGLFTLGGAGNVTVSSTLTQSGGLTKTGAGLLTLSASNSYSGATNIQSGTLRLGFNNAIPGGSAITIGSAGSAATLDVATHALSISSLTFAGQGGTLPDAAGTVTLRNLATGTARIDVLAGTNNEFRPNVTLSSPTVIDIAPGADLLLRATLSGTAPLTKSGAGLLEIFGNNEAYTGLISLRGGTTSLLGGNASLGSGTTTVFTGATLDFNGLPFTGTYFLDGGTVLNIASGSSQVVVDGNSTISGTVASSASFAVTSTGSAAFDITLSSSSSVVVDLGGQATFNGSVGGLVDAHGTSDFKGNVVSGANVQVGKAGESGASSTFAGPVSQTAVVTVNGGAAALFSGTVGGSISTSGTVDISSRVLGTGGLVVNAGGVARLLDGATYEAADIETAGSLVVNRTTNLALGATIDGVGSLIKQGASTLTLTNANGYTGGSTISAGTLALSGSGTLASQGAVALGNGAALDISAASGSRTIGALSGTAGSQVILGANGLTAGNGTSTTFAGGIGGSGNFTKAGAGGLTFAGANTYTGATTITAGTLGLSGAGSIQSSSGVNLSAAGAAFSIAGASGNRTIGAIEGVAGSSILLGGNGLTAGGASNTAFSGVISGSGGFTKVGAGILNLGGMNTFTGPTSIAGGTLIVNGALASDVSAHAETTLAGSGLIAGAISGAGLVSPGNSPGIMTADVFDPTGGLDTAFEFTAFNPVYSQSGAGALNDVLRLTDASEPFAAPLTATNIVNVYFNVTQIDGWDTFTGGFFTDKDADFLASVSNATYNFYVRGNGSGTATTFNGQGYYDLSSWGPANINDYRGVTRTTTQVASADFASGTVTNGWVTQFIVVPEPSTIIGIAGAGAIVVFGRIFRRRKAVRIVSDACAALLVCWTAVSNVAHAGMIPTNSDTHGPGADQSVSTITLPDQGAAP